MSDTWMPEGAAFVRLRDGSKAFVCGEANPFYPDDGSARIGWSVSGGIRLWYSDGRWGEGGPYDSDIVGPLVEPGEGWRILERDDVLVTGDSISWNGGKSWTDEVLGLAGEKVGQRHRDIVFRRRITPPAPQWTGEITLPDGQRYKLVPVEGE